MMFRFSPVAAFCVRDDAFLTIENIPETKAVLRETLTTGQAAPQHQIAPTCGRVKVSAGASTRVTAAWIARPTGASPGAVGDRSRRLPGC